jgi:hypothetical protein
LPGLIALLCVLAGVGAAPAGAAVPNACRYSFDDYYRDTPFSIAGAASVLAAPPRYPSSGTEADPGQTIRLAGAPLEVSLPSNLAEFGYRSQLLHAGENTIPIKVWVAIRATNTFEGVQVQGPFSLTATTTITIEPSDESFVSATPFEFDAPMLAPSDWTAAGGDVVFSQGGPGSLGVLPVGPSGAPRTTAGSIVVQAQVGAGGSVSFYMDCQPGAVINPAVTDLAGPTFEPATPAPFDSTVTGPRNATCISAQGRLAEGAAANLPATVTREIDPIGLTLSATGNATTATTGSPYTLGGAKLHLTVPAATIATLANFEDPVGSDLITSDEVYPLDLWVAVAGTNTVEGTQTVRASVTSYALHSTGPGAWDAYSATIDLPATTWTPAAAGQIAFSIAHPGAMTPLQVAGVAGTPGTATGDPLGATAATTYTLTPYGSAVLRAGTERNAATFDCVPGAVSIANALVGFSNLGRVAPPGGSIGRYAIAVHPQRPLIASATAADATTTPPPAVAPPAAPPPPPPVTPPAVPPPPPPPAAGPGKIASTALSGRGGKLRVVITCAASTSSCSGKISLRSALKLRVGRKLKTVTIARDATYTVTAGKRKTLTLTLGSEARTLLKRRSSLRVKVTLKPARGASSTRTLTLRR